jgi:hypothetical protein
MLCSVLDQQLPVASSGSARFCTAGVFDICDAVAHPGFIECDDDSKRCLVLNAEAM